MTKKQIEEKLQNAFERYEEEVQEIAKEYRDKVLVPYCKENEIGFIAGMGAMTFYNKHYNCGISDVEIQDTLELPVEGLCFLGHNIQDIKI